MNYQQLLNELKSNFDFQSYGLEEGFSQFEKSVLECQDYKQREQRSPFDWKDNEGNDKTVYILIVDTPIQFDEDGDPCRYETSYQVFENQFGN